ncbi:CwfJ C-terminus 1-domain-containing protein-like protein [Triangularia setosa]|uniref:CwfJ C-terminus 1-domain-containing protein-like protein n=1 Tax=Triangularia setosa TaxID=2587417 RepID=A0AAN6W9J8_9PEZI|nr:CwfJ C-terminus 1-domain-containing protein-like protein [Podospora setosa]
MDSLEDFEKSLAAEKAERERQKEKEERRERKHRHHHRRDKSTERDSRDSHRDRDRDRDKEKDRDSERRRRRDDDDDASHRHKRSRRDEDDESRRYSHRHRNDEKDHERDRDRERVRERHSRRSGKDTKDLKESDPKEDLPLPDEELAPNETKATLVRDSWMTAPSALDIDYVHRGNKRKSPSPVREEPKRVLHHRELNRGLDETSDMPTEETETERVREVKYTFGDDGSQWRMTKLKAVYTIAEETGRKVDEVAIERFGSLRDFDDAREEKIEADRRKVYGNGYIGKEKPTGDLYAERLASQKKRSPSPTPPGFPSRHLFEEGPPKLKQGMSIEDKIAPAAPMDQSALNRMRAQLMKAKLRNSPDVPKLEAEYNAAMTAFQSGQATSNAIVLDASHSRLLAGGSRGEVKQVTNKRGLERGTVVENEDMSLDDMVREERRTRGQAGGEGMRLAERIAKDGKFNNDLEYLDENAEKLAKRVHKTDSSLKNIAVTEYKKLNRILDTCPLCYHEDKAPPQNLPLAPVISLATRTYLTLPPSPELTGAEGGAVIVPLSHRTNLLECDDDEWEEIRNFMKSLTRLYHDQGREVLFYENAAAPQRRLHAAMVAVPIPYELGDTAPAFFREAMMSSDEEWSQHKKVIDTLKKSKEPGFGRMAFRKSIAKEMPYFHVWFGLDGGLGHVVEDSSRWPRGDGFAREIIGGMLDAEPEVIKKQGKWNRGDARVEGFRKRWRKWDWTRVLEEGQA